MAKVKQRISNFKLRTTRAEKQNAKGEMGKEKKVQINAVSKRRRKRESNRTASVIKG